MKLLFVALLMMIGAESFAIGDNDKKKGELDGTWVPVRQELGGKLLPESALKNQRLVIDGNKCSLTTQRNDNGTIKYANGKLDIYGGDVVNKGKHFTGIYKFANGQLFVCLNMLGQGYPVDYETQGKQWVLLSVFKKQK